MFMSLPTLPIPFLALPLRPSSGPGLGYLFQVFRSRGSSLNSLKAAKVWALKTVASYASNAAADGFFRPSSLWTGNVPFAPSSLFRYLPCLGGELAGWFFRGWVLVWWCLLGQQRAKWRFFLVSWFVWYRLIGWFQETDWLGRAGMLVRFKLRGLRNSQMQCSYNMLQSQKLVSDFSQTASNLISCSDSLGWWLLQWSCFLWHLNLFPWAMADSENWHEPKMLRRQNNHQHETWDFSLWEHKKVLPLLLAQRSRETNIWIASNYPGSHDFFRCQCDIV